MQQQEMITKQYIEQKLFIKFETDKHEVDIDIIGKSLLAFNLTLKTLAVKSNSEGIKIKVEAFKEGSLELPLSIIATASLPESFSFCTNVIEYVKDLYSLYKFTQGEPIKSIDSLQDNKINVENKFGERCIFNNCTFNTYSIIPSSPLGDTEKMHADKDISGISILDGQRNVVTSIPKDDFKHYVPYRKTMSQQNDMLETFEAELFIAEIDLYKTEKNWGFIYNGHPIKAKVLDIEFKEKINKGHPFRKGDRLRVVLQKTKIYDSGIKTYRIKKYEILEVIEYIQVQGKEHPLLEF